MKYKKAYLQISFAWIFAIIAGIFILFLAIYATTKLISTEQEIQDAKTGKEIGILLNPLETGFETGKTTSLTLPVETRIYNKCNNEGVFGKQLIQISQKSFNKWTETNVNVGFANKYIFSNKYAEGEKFYIFSKAFEFPFKISDLIYLTSSSDKYCFVNAPEEIKEELEDLNQKNILLANCSEQDTQVCFGGGSCDINVDYNMNSVEKNNEKVYFEGDALMYAGIFTDKEIYECQLKRLMQRIEQLALIYKDKASFISSTGCNSNLNQDLISLSNYAKTFGGSSELNQITYLVEDIESKNNLAECKLW